VLLQTSVPWHRGPAGELWWLINGFPSLCGADPSQRALMRFLRPELDRCAHNESGVFTGSGWQDPVLRVIVKYSVKYKKTQRCR